LRTADSSPENQLFVNQKRKKETTMVTVHPYTGSNSRPLSRIICRVGSSLALAACLLPCAQAQNAYLQHNLVSDLPGQADVTDTNLVNPWGIATSAASPFWISDNHSGVSTLYTSTGAVQALVVTIPPPAGGQGPAAPTGIIFNSSSASFLVATNKPARFIFATEDGTITGWNSGTNAVLMVDNSASNAVYKGLAVAISAGSSFLYASDFHNGKVDVFDSSFKPVNLTNAFTDSTIPVGFAPFGIQNIGGNIYVSYAMQNADKHDDTAGPGNGYVNIFDPTGHMIKRFASQGPLNSPWGMAMAPVGFGQFSGALLVGNFGDGTINAFDPSTGAPLGHLNDTNGAAISINGLWGLKFGNGGQGGDPFKLYFAAGIPGGGTVEDHGLFGSLSVASTVKLSVGMAATNTISLSWTGGTPPYLVQRRVAFPSTNWFDVLTTTNLSALLPTDAAAGFFRVMDHATTNVTPFTVRLSGANEVIPVATDATGVGLLSLAGSNLNYQISFSGLSGPAQASHVHGPADTSHETNVITPFPNIPASTNGTFSGTADISSYTPDLLTALKSGQTYANIHTAAHPAGEIRGQVAPMFFTASLAGTNEPARPVTSATGAANLTLVGYQLFWTLTYSGLSTEAIGAHIHGPAAPGVEAPVLFPFGTPTGTSGTLTGTQTLTQTELDELLDGQTYVNVHTTANAGGEIRGQVMPQQ
jgi:uncharacterized protein (TIGR03118 family)